MAEFHVKGLEPLKKVVCGINVFPAMLKLTSWLPDGMRKNMNTKQQAPSGPPPYDQYDCLGTSPYKTEEVMEGKIWRVSYSVEEKGLTDEKAKKESKDFGMDWTDEKNQKKILAAAELEGEAAVERAKKDIEKITEIWKKTDWTMEERMTLVPPHVLNSLVVKLNNGSLLLYAPVRVRDEVDFGSWLDSLGKVDWIIIASSFHTLYLPSVLARYPQAKVIGAQQAEDKLNFVGALERKKFDFNTSIEGDLEKANQILEPEGVKLYSTKGDVLTNAIIAIAHGILFECDLIYGDINGGVFGLSKEEFDKEDAAGLRLFKYLFCSKPNSPNGFLATYRFLMMDHTGMSQMMYEPAAKDGSSCVSMAQSLRSVLQQEFSKAHGVHFTSMTREEFRQSLDANWNWLDGKSLI